MKIIKKFKKSEKGSITIMVLASMLLMIGIITASYLAISNKSIGQNKKISRISKQYQVTNEDMEQEYREVLNHASLTIQQTQSNGMFEKTENTETMDDYGNRIVIPAGFKVTDDTTKVTEGIVIEDKEGNQFVWVPVGEIYTDDEKTETQKKTITLGRYEFAEDGTPSNYVGKYEEETIEEHQQSNYENTISNDINEFITSANNNNGYYIGRYEARKCKELENDSFKVTENLNDNVYNEINQLQAASLSKSMYTSNRFVSDLVNSYAWDTAILFLQLFDDRTNTTIPYSRASSLNSDFAIQGTHKLESGKQDKICNIWDMADNYREWSTETSNKEQSPCVIRGGFSR